MIPLRNLLIAVLAISFFTFVALFGRLPALRKTPIGWLQRLLCIRVPATFRRLDGSLTGGRLSRSLSSLETYLLYQKNPVVLVRFPSLHIRPSLPNPQPQPQHQHQHQHHPQPTQAHTQCSP